MTPEERRIERFLHDATRGLSRRKRAEAQAELRSHLHERVNQLILLGKPLPSAQAQAMQELGAPGAIARGLRRSEQVHPLLSAAALAGLAGLLLWPLPQFRAERLLSEPGNVAYGETRASLLSSGYLTLSQVREQLEPLGIGLEKRGDFYLLTASGLTDAPLAQNGAVFWCMPPVVSGQDRPTVGELLSGHLTEYADSNSLVTCMARAGWPLQASPTGLSLRGQPLPLTAEAVSAYLPSLTRALTTTLPAPTWTGFTAAQPVVFPVPAKGGTQPIKLSIQTPVLLLERRTNPRNLTVFAAALYWPDAAGRVNLPSNMRLYTSQTDWLAAPTDQKAGILLSVTRNATDPIALTPVPFQ